MAKSNLIKMATPKGVAKYPWLTKPNIRFNPDGEYSVNLLLPKDDPETESFCKALDDLRDEAYNTQVEAFKKDKKPADAARVKKADAPYSEEFDKESGDPTGMIEFKFKLKATVKSNDKVISLSPKLFDAKGKLITEDVGVYGGSIIKVNFSPKPYYVAATKTAGITLRMNAVQVIELVQGGGSSNARDYGFGEEEGYAYESTESQSAQEINNEETPDF